MLLSLFLLIDILRFCLLLLSFGILLSSADKDTKDGVKDIALSTVSIAGGALVGGSRGNRKETNIETVEQGLEGTNQDN